MYIDSGLLTVYAPETQIKLVHKVVRKFIQGPYQLELGWNNSYKLGYNML